jgi:hypothetical protein
MVRALMNLNLVALIAGLLILLNSFSLLYPTSGINGQQNMNDNVGQNMSNMSNASQTSGESFNRSIIGTVINITNNTNPTGAAVQQMIQATSSANITSNANITSAD